LKIRERKDDDESSLVVIVGGGFGGLAAAKGLKRSPVDVLLIDRSNHHVFQPLLYQVATSVLPGTDRIAHPQPLGRTDKYIGNDGQRDWSRYSLKAVIVDSDDKIGIRISYDYLILATGATHSYFGITNSPPSHRDSRVCQTRNPSEITY